MDIVPRSIQGKMGQLLFRQLYTRILNGPGTVRQPDPILFLFRAYAVLFIFYHFSMCVKHCRCRNMDAALLFFISDCFTRAPRSLRRIAP